jgi:dimethylargininase
MPRLLVRPPSSRLAEGELTHLERVAVDAALARSQWEAYVTAFRARGWEIIGVPQDDAQADGVFVEDAVVLFDDLAVLCRAGAPSRRGEAATVAPVVAQLDVERAEILAPATLDGGDVLKVGRTAYVGRSARTNDAAIDQLRELLEPRGWRVVAVPVNRVLHLKSAVTALPDGTVIGYPPLVDDPDAFDAFLPVPEEHGTAVVVLDAGTVLMSADAPATARLFQERGLEVVTVPVTEFEKLEGCVTCLSVRVRDTV